MKRLLGRVPHITFVLCLHFLVSQKSVLSCPEVTTIDKLRLSRKNQNDPFSFQGLALGSKICRSSTDGLRAWKGSCLVFHLGGKTPAVLQKPLLSPLYCKQKSVPKLLWIFCVICFWGQPGTSVCTQVWWQRQERLWQSQKKAPLRIRLLKKQM